MIDYSYEMFLWAASRFPAFCNEYGSSDRPNLENQDVACKRELSFLFAHIIPKVAEFVKGDDSEYFTGISYFGNIDCNQDYDYEKVTLTNSEYA